MSGFVEDFRGASPCDGVDIAGRNAWAFAWLWLVAGLLTLTLPISSYANGHIGTSSAGARIDFRIVIPAIIRVAAVAQPERIVVEARHVAQGYIDLDAGTSVKITNNTRGGFLLTASYDAQLLSMVEVRISGQNLTASSGTGSMRVESGIVVDKLVPISYRLYLAPGARTGDYRWPVALAFSLAST